MAVPSYTNDLTTIVDFDGTPSSPSVSEPSTGWRDGRSPAVDTDYPIQGTQHCSLVMNTTGKAGVLCDNGASFSWPSGDYLFGWIIWLAPGAIAERASGGLAMLCGSGVGDYKVFYVGGKSFGLYPYGGWQNFAVDPEMTYDEIFGSPTGYYIIGGGANVLSTVSKGSPLGFDAFRYGRGILYIDDGSSGDGYATFVGAAAANDASSARWGLFQSIGGGYKQKGILSFGENSYCEFVDSNKSITIDESIYVNSDFNRIEIHDTSSIVYWSNVVIRSLCTVSPGQFEMIDAADVQFDSCTFINMDTFIFLSTAQITNSTFQGCQQINSGGGVFTGTKVITPVVAADTSAFVWNAAIDTDGYLDDMTFVKGTNSHHAIELGTSSPTEVTLRGLTFSGFNASNGQTDSVVHVKRTSGAVIINAVGCSGTISYKSDGASVTVVVDPVTLAIHVEDIETGDPIVGARALAYVTSATGGYPYQESVSLSRIGSIVTVAHTDHGLIDNDSVLIAGANEVEYNGAHQITTSGVDYYYYTITGTPSSPATGTPTSTFAIINGYTVAGGNISASKSYSDNQPFAGRIRFASIPASGLYKSSPISGTVNSTSGASVTVLMIPD